jgi:hypothetical protein
VKGGRVKSSVKKQNAHLSGCFGFLKHPDSFFLFFSHTKKIEKNNFLLVFIPGNNALGAGPS